jgi:integrase
LIPVLGNAWIGDLDLPELNATIRYLTLHDGTPASDSTKGTVASVLRRLFAWAREERIIPVNPALELRTGWGGSVRRRRERLPGPGRRPATWRVVIPSIPQVLRLAEALDHFKPGLGDVAVVLAFTGLRWGEAVAVLIDSVNLGGQSMVIDRTASESGGRRDIRDGHEDPRHYPS